MGTAIGILFSLSVLANQQSPDRIRLEAVIDAPVAAVWAAYTTKAGLESWMVPHAQIELAVGGSMRTHFDPKGAIGDAETIENTILTYEPERMLSLKVAKAPDSLPYKAAVSRIWSVVYFTAENGKTRITEVTMGFGPEAEAQELRQFLEGGNRMLLQRLQARFAKTPK